MTCAEFEQYLPEIVDGTRTAEQDAHLHSCNACAGVISDLNLIQQQARTLQGSEEPSAVVWQSIAATVGQWQSEMDLIAQQARQLQASEEPSPRVWNAIATELHQWQSEMDLIAQQARQLQGSEEPSPRVWNAIAAELHQWQSEMTEIADGAQSLRESEEPSPRVWNSLEIALRQEGLIRRPQPDRLIAAGRPGGWRWAWLAPVAAVLIVMVALVSEKGDTPGVFQRASNKAPVSTASVLSEDEQMLDALASRTPAMRTVYENNLRNVNAYIHDAEQSVRNDPTDEAAQESLVNAYDQKSMLYEMALDRSLP
jgi:hypothetical protein